MRMIHDANLEFFIIDFVEDPCMEMDHQDSGAGGRSMMKVLGEQGWGDGRRTKVELIEDVPWVIRGCHDWCAIEVRGWFARKEEKGKEWWRAR